MLELGWRVGRGIKKARSVGGISLTGSRSAEKEDAFLAEGPPGILRGGVGERSIQSSGINP